MTTDVGKQVLEALRAMENDVQDIERWGSVILCLGQAPETVDTGGLYVIGNVLLEIGERLKRNFSAAWAAGVER